MEIQNLYSEIESRLEEWNGKYYLHASEGRRGINIGGEKDDYPQEIGIEILSEEHPEPEDIELQLRRLVEGTKWVVSDDGFLNEGWSSTTREVFLSREIEAPSGFSESFEESREI